MPTPGPIRKEILHALEETIIPALWQRNTALGSVALPWQFPGSIQTRLLSPRVPRADTGTPEFPLQVRWPRANLNSGFYPYFGFIYEGMADERTLVTAAQAKKYAVSKGVYAIRWQAPSVLLFPPGVPHNAGDTDFWHETKTPPSRRILWFSLGPELLLHTHQADTNGLTQVSHSLQINDRDALMLTDLFVRRLQDSDEQEEACAALLALVLRLQKVLSAGPIPIANTSRLPLPAQEALASSEQPSALLRETAIFIQMHLHETLTLKRIAQQARLSPAHLNRLFQRFYGVTLMRYVREQRVAAAKRILCEGPENISEIAALVGFKSAGAFCDVFRRETGLAPGQFRRRAGRGSTPMPRGVLLPE